MPPPSLPSLVAREDRLQARLSALTAAVVEAGHGHTRWDALQAAAETDDRLTAYVQTRRALDAVREEIRCRRQAGRFARRFA